jgi:uncharacterized membrane protein YebE (DUF533 family)
MYLKPDQGDGIERKRMGVEAGTVDFGHLTARNRLIKEVVAPAVDALLAAAKSDHVIDSKTTYTIQILITSEREISIN